MVLSTHRNLFRRHTRRARAAGGEIDERTPIYPVTPALANALTDATGIRFHDLPLTPDRIYRRIFESSKWDSS